MTSNEILAELVRLHESVEGYTYSTLPAQFLAAMLQRGASVKEHVNTKATFLVATINTAHGGEITCHGPVRTTSLRDKSELGARGKSIIQYPVVMGESGWVRTPGALCEEHGDLVEAMEVMEVRHD